MLKIYINKTIDDNFIKLVNNILNSYERKINIIQKNNVLKNKNINNEDFLKNEIIKLEDSIKSLNEINLEKTRDINILEKENFSDNNIQYINKLEKRYFSFLNDIEIIEKNNFFINYLNDYKTNVEQLKQEKILKDLNFLLKILEQKFENLNNSNFFQNIPKVNDYISKKSNANSNLEDKLYIENFIKVNKNKIFNEEDFIKISLIFNKFENIIKDGLKNNSISFEDYNKPNQLIEKYIQLIEKEEYYSKKLLDKNNKIEKYHEVHNFMNTLNKYILDNITPIKLEVYKSNVLLMKELKKFSNYFKSVGVKESLIEIVNQSFQKYEKNIKEKVKSDFNDLKNIHLETFEEKIEKAIDNVFNNIHSTNGVGLHADIYSMNKIGLHNNIHSLNEINLHDKINNLENSNYKKNESFEEVKDNTIFYNKNLEKIEKKEEIQEINYI